ncbi:hypothetical protein [Streptacidiphilus sp. P02-A3a]|uniref:effector-associated constant component EACC1 n=1 Tax=Streptacidiphilus sp. P02-A3a TaxID=2704468 RepID=UPI0015FE04B5|nr:hypothetical protein [Streptacidiphilus sp. P02-A3a]QMU69620.1 hypothetical protein GXP74_16610 [Streptacidiphilus sp. P02-A3a]
MTAEHASHQRHAIVVTVSDPVELRSLHEHLRRVPGAEVTRIPGRPGPGEQGAWDVLEVLTGSGSALAVVVRALPDFIRSRRSDITVTMTSGDRSITINRTNVGEDAWAAEVKPVLDEWTGDA